MCLGVLVHNIIAQKTMCRAASKQSIQLHTQHLRITFALGHILDIGVAITHTRTETHTHMCVSRVHADLEQKSAIERGTRSKCMMRYVIVIAAKRR